MRVCTWREEADKREEDSGECNVADIFQLQNGLRSVLNKVSLLYIETRRWTVVSFFFFLDNPETFFVFFFLSLSYTALLHTELKMTHELNCLFMKGLTCSLSWVTLTL